MPANFTSGWLGNGEVAWHGQGVVTEGTLPAREAFETAEALFTVEKRELQYTNDNAHQTTTSLSGSRLTTSESSEQTLKRYLELSPSNTRLSRTIRSFGWQSSSEKRQTWTPSSFYSNGAKVCFTATLRGAETDIVPGDTVKRRLVGWLGHDGKTGCGACFTNIRVVCQNTLTAALGDASRKLSISHKGEANQSFNALIESIDCARQDFVQETDLMREFARASMGVYQFNEFVDEVYNVEEGQVFRKREKLERAFRAGYGSEYAPLSLWNGINAITEVETSTRGISRAKGNAQFARGTFGAGASISKRAFSIAQDLLVSV